MSDLPARHGLCQRDLSFRSVALSNTCFALGALFQSRAFDVKDCLAQRAQRQQIRRFKLRASTRTRRALARCALRRGLEGGLVLVLGDAEQLAAELLPWGMSRLSIERGPWDASSNSGSKIHEWVLLRSHPLGKNSMARHRQVMADSRHRHDIRHGPDASPLRFVKETHVSAHPREAPAKSELLQRIPARKVFTVLACREPVPRHVGAGEVPGPEPPADARRFRDPIGPQPLQGPKLLCP